MMDVPQVRDSHLEPLQPPACTVALQAVWREASGKDAGWKWVGTTKSVFAKGIEEGKVGALKGFALVCWDTVHHGVRYLPLPFTP